MNRLYVLLVALALGSCSKKDVDLPALKPTPIPNPLPNMQYTDLHNAEVKKGKYQAIDLDGDGVKDFSFGTYLIGDALNKEDKLRFAAFSNIDKHLLVDDDNASPVLSAGDVVPVQGVAPYEWYQISEVLLIEKVTGMVKPPYWRGAWNDRKNKFFPLQILKNGKRYNGWIELSFDAQGERLILHQAAISKEAETEVRAGM